MPLARHQAVLDHGHESVGGALALAALVNHNDASNALLRYALCPTSS
jgi:hypothetical protein